MNYALGIDIGGTSVKFGLCDTEGKVLDTHAVPTLSETGSPETIVSQIVKGAKELMAKHPSAAVVGAGVGVPGCALPDTGVITFLPNIPCFQDFPLGKDLTEKLGMSVTIDNDANNAARGEYLFGSARGIKNFVFITLGTGVGGGIFIGGDLYAGEINYSGEVGHMTLQPGGRPCGCGNFGCWEAYSSATAMILETKNLLSRGYASSLSKVAAADINPKTIDEHAKKGDALAVRMMDEAAQYTGLALANLMNALNPGACIIGGGISASGDFLLQKIRNAARVYALPKIWESCEIRLASLGNNAGLQGSAALAFMKTSRS